MNFFDHKDLGNHLLKLCPKVVNHPVYIYILVCVCDIPILDTIDNVENSIHANVQTLELHRN